MGKKREEPGFMEKVLAYAVGLLCITQVTGEILTESAVEEGIIPNVMRMEHSTLNEPNDDFTDVYDFDFIVVGAGAAGSVMASRLSEVNSWSVLLLEAGLEETYPMFLPYFDMTGMPLVDWGYKMAPQPNGGCPAGPDSACPYPRAKVMGGSTTLNSMLLVRGNKNDYDLWARMSSSDWSYRNVLPYFKNIENVQIAELRNSPFHGTKGYIPNSRIGETVFTNISFAAASELGIPIVDYNGEDMTGISYLQTSTKDGIRWSASRGYLHPAHRRPNLFVRKGSVVTRIITEGNRAVGVEYVREGKTYTASATREVILSAGAINSPQLLMVSGIGPRDQLERLNIPVVRDLPVGRTLIDQAIFMGLPIVTKTPLERQRSELVTNMINYVSLLNSRKGPLVSAKGLEILRFAEIGEEAIRKHWANIELLVVAEIDTEDPKYWQHLGFTPDVFESFFRPLSKRNAFLPKVINLRPRSVGYLNLTSSSFDSAPIINPNILADDNDLRDLIEGVKDAVRLFTSGPFEALGAQIYNVPYPPCSHLEFMSDDYWACTIRRATVPSSHPTGTCRMGRKNDRDAVVTPDLRVKGVESLRVVDASVFPTMPSGHRQLPTYMVAERAAELVKGENGA